MKTEEEKELLKSIFRNLHSFISGDENWEDKLPISEDTNFQHKRFGLVSFSLCLDREIHIFFKKEVFVLTLKVIIGDATSRTRISVGESSKVKEDIKSFYENIEPICKELPEIYMGLLEYPRSSLH